MVVKGGEKTAAWFLLQYSPINAIFYDIMFCGSTLLILMLMLTCWILRFSPKEPYSQCNTLPQPCSMKEQKTWDASDIFWEETDITKHPYISGPMSKSTLALNQHFNALPATCAVNEQGAQKYGDKSGYPPLTTCYHYLGIKMKIFIQEILK